MRQNFAHHAIQCSGFRKNGWKVFITQIYPEFEQIVLIATCHMTLGPKLVAKLRAAKDVWHEIMGTIDDEEKFEAHRWQMANAVWDRMKATDSRECQSCHMAEAMDLREQDRSARKKHRRLLEENSEKTCIDCHKGVAHEVPKEPKKEDLAYRTNDFSNQFL